MAAAAAGGAAARAAPEEDAIIKHRFLTQMSVPKGIVPLKQLTKKFLQVLEGVDKADAERLYKEFLREVGQTELHARKLRAICDANKREQSSYMAKQVELEDAIEQAKRDIESKKAELKRAKELLDQNQQYEVLRHMIMEHPARSVTQQAIDREVRQTTEAKVEEAKVAQLMERRKKQFSLLFYVLEELQRTNDNTAEELAAIELLPPQPSAAAPTAAAGGQATAMDVDE